MSVNRILFVMQAVLVLHDGYIVEKSRANRTQNSPFQTVYILGVWGLAAASCIVCDCITSGYADLSSKHVLYIQYIYISIQYTYI